MIKVTELFSPDDVFINVDEFYLSFMRHIMNAPYKTRVELKNGTFFTLNHFLSNHSDAYLLKLINKGGTFALEIIDNESLLSFFNEAKFEFSVLKNEEILMEYFDRLYSFENYIITNHDSNPLFLVNQI